MRFSHLSLDIRMTDPAGKLHIRIGPQAVTIRSTRPVRAAALFAGRGLEETARLLPALYSICSTAQAGACAGALERALGILVDPQVAALRERLIEAETLREHLWRILLDWPRLQGETPDPTAMAQVMGHFGSLKSALCAGGDLFLPGALAARSHRPAAGQAALGLAGLAAERVLGESAASWLARVGDGEGLALWCARAGTGAARLVRRVLESGQSDLGQSPIGPLPRLPERELDACLAGAGANEFVARPTWEGAPRETSPLARNLDAPLVADLTGLYGNGLLTRLAAQLYELAGLAARLGGTDGAAAAGPAAAGLDAWLDPGSGLARGLGPGVGLAQIQAARGLLVHRVRIGEGRVADYRILAPTEWSFHPAGAVALGLADLAERAAPAALPMLARLFVAAVDPCVDFELDLRDVDCIPEPALGD